MKKFNNVTFVPLLKYPFPKLSLLLGLHTEPRPMRGFPRCIDHISILWFHVKKCFSDSTERFIKTILSFHVIESRTQSVPDCFCFVFVPLNTYMMRHTQHHTCCCYSCTNFIIPSWFMVHHVKCSVHICNLGQPHDSKGVMFSLVCFLK